MTDLQTLTSMARRMALEEVYASLPDNSDDEIVKVLSWGVEPSGCVLCEQQAGAEPKEVLETITSIEGTILNALIEGPKSGRELAELLDEITARVARTMANLRTRSGFVRNLREGLGGPALYDITPAGRAAISPTREGGE